MSEEREISIQPDFTIYGDGTPMCKNHSFHDSITPDNEEKIIFFQKFKNYHKVNCLTCSHYHQNHCYYSKQQIETFEFQRKTSHLHCIYCGDKIRNLFSILYSDYSIKQYSKMANHSYIIKIPFICCSC